MAAKRTERNAMLGVAALAPGLNDGPYYDGMLDRVAAVRKVRDLADLL